MQDLDFEQYSLVDGVATLLHSIHETKEPVGGRLLLTDSINWKCSNACVEGASSRYVTLVTIHRMGISQDACSLAA